MKLRILRVYLRLNAFSRRANERAEQNGYVLTVCAQRKIQNVIDRLIGPVEKIEAYIRSHEE